MLMQRCKEWEEVPEGAAPVQRERLPTAADSRQKFRESRELVLHQAAGLYSPSYRQNDAPFAPDKVSVYWCSGCMVTGCM